MALRFLTSQGYPLPSEDGAHMRIPMYEAWAYVEAAAQHVQNVTGRALATQQWELTLDAFPRGPIHLPLPPLQTVDSIIYIDAAGDEQTWESYDVDMVGGRITPLYGTSYPATRAVQNAVTVRFTCGYKYEQELPYGIRGEYDVPEGIHAAVMLFAADLYEHREAQSDVQLYENRTANALLAPYRVW